MWTSTIMDKSPWDSAAIFIFFCHSGLPHKTVHPFRNFPAFLPSPHLIQSWNSEKNSGCTHPTLFVGWGEVLGRCELENAPETQKCPKTFVHDWMLHWTKIGPFLCERRLRLATSFGTFLCRPYTTTTWNFRMQRLMAEVNTRRIIFPFLSLNLVAVPRNSIRWKFVHVWHFEQVGTKFDKKKPCIFFW